jgi:hypothetical protein
VDLGKRSSGGTRKLETAGGGSGGRERRFKVQNPPFTKIPKLKFSTDLRFLVARWSTENAMLAKVSFNTSNSLAIIDEDKRKRKSSLAIEFEHWIQELPFIIISKL